MTEHILIMYQRSYITWLVNIGDKCLMHGFQDKAGKEEKKGAKELKQDLKSESGRTEVSQGSRRSTKQVL